jgi:hypothetical protein
MMEANAEMGGASYYGGGGAGDRLPSEYPLGGNGGRRSWNSHC